MSATQTDTFLAVMNAVTFPWEGTLTNDPEDPGGLTNMGLTMDDLRRYSASATANDLRTLTRDEALGIYLALYWMPVQGYALQPAVACMVFDHGVNAGIGDSGKLLQRAIGFTGGPGQLIDGNIGPDTRDATLAVNDVAGLLARLWAAQDADYRSKIDAARYLDGWENRLGTQTSPAPSTRYGFSRTLLVG